MEGFSDFLKFRFFYVQRPSNVQLSHQNLDFWRDYLNEFSFQLLADVWAIEGRVLEFPDAQTLEALKNTKWVPKSTCVTLGVLDKKPHSSMKPKEIQPKVIKFQWNNPNCVLELFWAIETCLYSSGLVSRPQNPVCTMISAKMDRFSFKWLFLSQIRWFSRWFLPHPHRLYQLFECPIYVLHLP